MKLGIGSYTFTWAIGVPGHPPIKPMTPLDLVAEAQRLAVRVVQFCDNLPLTSLSPAELDQFEQATTNAGLDVEIGTRGLDEQNLLAHLALAVRFRSPFVRLVVDAGNHHPSPDEVVDRLTPLVPRFDDAGVKLALENHDRFQASALAHIAFELSCHGLDYETVGICLDTVNSFGALEGPEVVVRELAPYTLNLHLKDFTITRVSSQMGFTVTGCPAGQGRLNVPWLLDELRHAKRNVNAILELWVPFGPTLEETIARERDWAGQSIRYLRPYIPD